MNAKPHTHPDKESEPRYVRADFIAKKYNVTSRYVLQMAAEGKIPCLRLGRKCVRFLVEDVAAALEGGAR